MLASKDGRWVDTGILRGLKLNGRGLAAADYDNDGRVDLAVNTVGGRLVLLHNTSPSGHWLGVQVQPLSPGAVVTLVRRDNSPHGARGAGRVELSLVGGSARAFRPRQATRRRAS